jgi:hypothetical protein
MTLASPLRPFSLLVGLALLVPIGSGAADHPPAPAGRVLFSDDFNDGLRRWDVLGARAVTVRESGDAAHGAVLELVPDGDVIALIRGSDAWPSVRVEGDMLFPTDIDNYLGLAYRVTRAAGRWDFGLVYVKGNDGYLQLNPHRDYNVSRLLYPEFRTPLAGPSAVETGVWQRFALEVVGRDVHVYVGDTSTPQMTVLHDDRPGGRLGLQPRSIGGSVWVDNVVVRALDRLSYGGPPIPDVRYAPATLLTAWEVAGPFAATDDDIARHPAVHTAWRPAPVDDRGAVVSGRDVDYHGPRTVAYYRTRIASALPAAAEIVFGTVDDLTVWVNGRLESFVPRQDAAWFDVHVNPQHPGRRLPLDLVAGDNDVVVRVRGGVYASGGFFARLVRE